jgi:signal transduction histidine kinase
LEIAHDIPRFDSDVETTLFRIVQECLTNIYRHSGSATATVMVTLGKAQIRLEVRDFGSGTAPDALRHIKAGVGLRGMNERVRQLKGTFDISSAEPGIRVVAQIPIDDSSRG